MLSVFMGEGEFVGVGVALGFVFAICIDVFWNGEGRANGIS